MYNLRYCEIDRDWQVAQYLQKEVRWRIVFSSKSKTECEELIKLLEKKDG
jgi:hypothetical protein